MSDSQLSIEIGDTVETLVKSERSYGFGRKCFGVVKSINRLAKNLTLRDAVMDGNFMWYLTLPIEDCRVFRKRQRVW